ncbi:MAG: dihydroxyacetone kinase [Candidatus Lokiarchaeota archaeon]|nr:dihydroxyacetone kinase [Candidatus Lokiarchaeota archaeon]
MIRKKILNDPDKVVEELIEGIVAASGGKIKKIEGVNALIKSRIPIGKIGLLIGGGSGHEPLFPGFIGKNLADAAACGEVFTAPPPNVILKATEELDHGNGIIYLYGNYDGDNMNFDIAAEMAEERGISIKTVRVWDDVASAPLDKMEQRRGIAGDLFVIKIAGAASALLDDLDEVYRISCKARNNTRSMGVAVSAGSIPATGEPTFTLPEDEIEIGMGLHGEPGVSREKLMSADVLVEKMMDKILTDLPYQKGDEVCLLINNLGATTMMELFIVNRKVAGILNNRDIKIYDTIIGSYCTSQEMAGFSITLIKLDEELKKYYNLDAKSLAFTKM